jgi:hypothetical protein
MMKILFVATLPDIMIGMSEDEQSAMLPPIVRDRISLQDGHLHCRSCGVEVPVDTKPRFCAECMVNAKAWIKGAYYFEGLMLLTGVVVWLFWAVEIYLYWNEWEWLLVMQMPVYAIIMAFWWYMRYSRMSPDSWPFPKKMDDN